MARLRSSARASRLRLGALMLATLAASGCVGGSSTGGGPLNPNLLAPKLIVDRGADGRTEIYVHSAFGDSSYDAITYAFDNETLRTTNGSYSLDAKTNATGFYLTVAARSGAVRFTFAGRIDLESGLDKARVTDWSSGIPSAPKTFNLPYERILDRDHAEASA
ncbi:MAG: hypothetical protein ACYDCK_09625 [Thermoplasmatota archaeon]